MRTINGLEERVAVIDGMASFSTFPPPPGRPEPDVLRAHSILESGYLAAQDVANLGQPDLHQTRYHQERVSSELVPLLDAIAASTSDAVLLAWCYASTTSFVNLYKRLTQCEISARRRFGLKLCHCSAR